MTSPFMAVVLAELAEDEAARVEFASVLGPHLAPPPDPDELFDVAGAAAYLCCKERRIYDLASQRRLTVTRDGGRILFRRRHLDDHLKTESARA